MTDAKLLIDDVLRPAIRLERHLPDPPAVVWRALTEREQLRSWFPCDVAVSGERWEPGAAITFAFPPEVIDITLAGQVLKVDEPNLLAFTWGEEMPRFELSPEDGGTRLVLITNRPTLEFGKRIFGQDYDQRLVGWIEANYKLCGVLGRDTHPSMEIGDRKFFIRAYCRD